MLRIWIFFNKQTIYLEETTAQRKNPNRRTSGRESRAHSFMEISTSKTEYVPLRSVLRRSNCHFRSNLLGKPWFNRPRLTAPFIWFLDFQLDYGYLMTYCFSQKTSGREIAGVWKLARLVTADLSTWDFQRWREMSESDVTTSLN